MSVHDLCSIVPSIVLWACASPLENFSTVLARGTGRRLLKPSVFFNHVALRPWGEEPMGVACWVWQLFLYWLICFQGHTLEWSSLNMLLGLSNFMANFWDSNSHVMHKLDQRKRDLGEHCVSFIPVKVGLGSQRHRKLNWYLTWSWHIALGIF